MRRRTLRCSAREMATPLRRPQIDGRCLARLARLAAAWCLWCRRAPTGREAAVRSRAARCTLPVSTCRAIKRVLRLDDGPGAHSAIFAGLLVEDTRSARCPWRCLCPLLFGPVVLPMLAPHRCHTAQPACFAALQHPSQTMRALFLLLRLRRTR